MGRMTISEGPQTNLHGHGLITKGLPTSLLQQPLDYISADHSRQRLVCAALMRFAEAGRVDCDDAKAAVTFLSRDLRLHHRDEDEDLFPKLRKRAHANDKLDDLLSGLSQDHIQSMADVETITRVLAGEARAGQIKIATAERDVMLDFAKRERGHLAIENGIVMVIARKRLKGVDRALICRAMRQRRGLTD